MHQDGTHAIRLDLRDADGRIDLVVDLEPAFPRVLLRPHRKAPPQPSGLAGALRKQLNGARLTGATSVVGERALALQFTRPDDARTLWIELFGGQATWYLLDGEERVLWTLRGDVAARRDGTAHGALAARHLGFELAVKTGSADLVSRKDGETGRRVVRKHTWVAGWAPAEDPQVVLIVFVHDTQATSSHGAVYVARQFMRQPEVLAFLEGRGMQLQAVAGEEPR